MLKKHLKNIKYLSEVRQYAKKRISNLLLLLTGLIILSFVFLFFTGNLYVLLIDNSGSMGNEMFTRTGQPIKKIDALKNAVSRFIDTKFEGSFMVASYGNLANYPNAPFQIVDSILNYQYPENFSGNIIVSPDYSKELAKKKINDLRLENDNYLSEALYKILNRLNNVYNPYTSINIVIFGDGDDQNNCIQEGNNVITTGNWEFISKLKVHTIKIAADATGSNNFRILANAGKGESVDVHYVEDFYDRLLQFSKNEIIIITHIIISLLLIIGATFILLRK